MCKEFVPMCASVWVLYLSMCDKIQDWWQLQSTWKCQKKNYDCVHKLNVHKVKKKKNPTNPHTSALLYVCVCVSNSLLGCLSRRMTALITITIEGKDRTERAAKWVQEKPGFSEHNLLHISITIVQSRSMMGAILARAMLQGSPPNMCLPQTGKHRVKRKPISTSKGLSHGEKWRVMLL